MLIGKVIKKANKYIAEIIGDKRFTISNKCINFSQYEKVIYKNESRRIISNLPYNKENDLENFFVRLDDETEINIKELEKRKIDINDGDYCYFIFMNETENNSLLEYRGHCPKSLDPLLEDYYNENELERKETLKSIIYEQQSVKERKSSLDSKLGQRERALSNDQG